MAPSKELRFDNQVAVVTGAGAGLGRQYALCLASRGCKVVVNDLGGTFNGVGNSTSSKVADQVVEEIRKAGGEAVANYDNVLDGEKIVQTAVDEWGRVDILINNAGILRDVSLRNMKDADWDAIIGVHLHGAYKTSRAAWPYMRKQKFGRIIQTTSASGLFGNFGQSNYAAAKVALVGFGETLAKEGAKYNITCNILAPGAASRLTQTVWTEEMMRLMSTSWVVPLPIFLVHSSCNSNGALFEAGAGHFAKIRWERSRGLTLKTNGLTPQHILNNWSKVTDVTDAEHPDGPPEMMKLLQNANSMPDNKPVSNDGLQLKGKVALVTGAGAGLGRAYAMELAKYGCKVMVCDVKNAATVAEEIKKAGGEAKSTDISAERGDEVVKAVVDAWGRIDIAVNNAGIWRDKSMSKMSFEEWTQVMNCHLRSTFKVTKAAFPYMTKQKFGRIVNVTSTSGIYGNFGQANYAAAKAGIIGFTKAIGREGQKYNIKTNVLAPSAGTSMTKTIWPEDLVSAMDPSFVSPVVALLCSAACPINGTIIEAAGGWFATTRWQRTRGVDFDFEGGYPSVEDVAAVFDKIVKFDEEADWPETPAEGSFYTHQNVVKYLEAKAKL